MIASLALTLALLSAPPQAPAGETATDRIELALPAAWTRSEAEGRLTFARRPTDEAGAKIVSVLSPRPKTGNLRQTFLAMWKTLVKELAPDDPQERHLVPLVVRNRNGVVVAFDGEILERRPFRAMLYLVDCGDRVVPIVGIFNSDPPLASLSFVTSDKPTEMAKTMSDMVSSISLKKGKSPEGPLFAASELVGAYHQTDLAAGARFVDRSTGATVGDASSGSAHDFVFGANGAYAETSALVVEGEVAGVSTRKGSWRLVGNEVVVHYAGATIPDKRLLLMGIGLNRRADKTLAYLVDPRYVDKYFFQMFVEGADVSYFYCERKTG